MTIARTKSADETKELAAAIADLVKPGDLILLAGDLGAGKTAFAQGFGRKLGIEEPITSPTFTLARQYEADRMMLHHLDVYRLDRMAELFDVGLPELLDEGAVTLIEWGDAIVPALPADYLEIRMEFGDGDDDRVLTLRSVGASWSARRRILVEALDRWTDESGEAPSC